MLGEKQRNPVHEPVSSRKFHQLKDLVERTRDDVGVLLNELAFSTGDYYKSQLAHVKELLQAEIQVMNDKASCIKHKSVSRNSSAPSRSASSVHRHHSSQGGHPNLKKKSNQVKMHPSTNPQPQQPLAPSSTRSACRSQKVTLKRPISSNRMAGPPDRSALIFKHGQKVFEGGNHDFKNSASATFGNLRGPSSQNNTI